MRATTFKDSKRKVLEELFVNGHRRHPKVFDYYFKEDVDNAVAELEKIDVKNKGELK